MSWLVVVSGLAGLLFGSFANVVIHRVPLRRSILRPPSHCVVCEAPIKPRDNIPVLSWLVLRGRCRQCGAHISARYPLVEILTGIVFAMTAWRLTASTDLIAFLPLAWLLVVVSMIDIEHQIIPDRINLPALAVMTILLAISAALGLGWGSWLRALSSGAAAFVFFVIMPTKAMGGGDVKLSPVLGMALGYFGWGTAFVGFFLSFAAGAIGGLVLMAARRAGLKTMVPFGPWMALGTLGGIWWGRTLFDLLIGV